MREAEVEGESNVYAGTIGDLTAAPLDVPSADPILPASPKRYELIASVCSPSLCRVGKLQGKSP